MKKLLAMLLAVCTVGTLAFSGTVMAGATDDAEASVVETDAAEASESEEAESSEVTALEPQADTYEIPAIQPQEGITDGTVENWRQINIELISEAEYENPFLDVVISADFTGPSGQVIYREAYWDGENNYKIAFAPTEVGTWSYTVTAPDETGLNGITGTIEAEEYTGDLAIYQHGFLKTEEGKHYIMYNDGTSFFWLGDTHWAFAQGESWDESNNPEMTSQFRGMVDKRVSQEFTVYQTNLRADESFWDSDSETDLPNIEFYQNELDRRMYYIADSGLVNAMGFAWCTAIGYSGENVELMQHLARYIVARYGALPMVWTLAGEVDGYPGMPTDVFIESWEQVALTVDEADGYDQLQTAHPYSDVPYASFYEDEDWFDFTLNQAGHGQNEVNFREYKAFFEEHPDKPFVEGEFMYEGCSTFELNGARLVTADLVRRAAYIAMQSGCCGYTYGAQGIWDNVWDEDSLTAEGMASMNRYGMTWIDGINQPGADQMTIMKNFYIEQDYETMSPDYNPVRDEGFGGAHQALVLGNEERTHFIVYFPTDTNVLTCPIAELEAGATFTAQWFDPRTGEYTDADDLTVDADGNLTTDVMPDLSEDWLLVLNKADVQ